jgi:hypothetical protein
LISCREEDVLTIFITLSVICHGMFFAREWLLIGIPLVAYFLLFKGRKKNNLSLKDIRGSVRSWLDPPLIIFILLIILSLLGLCKPVRSIEGWLEALKWLIFCTVYFWGRSLSSELELREKIINRILLLAFVCTILSLLPGSEFVWPGPSSPEQGRFSLTFGYPNAAAAFLGCQILLLQGERRFKFLYLSIFAMALIGTGSRAALVLFLGCYSVLFLKKLVLNRKNKKALLKIWKLKLKKIWRVRGFLTVLPAGIILTLLTFNFNVGLEHLRDWTDIDHNERFLYYLDSFKLAWQANFLPRAGGWLAFPFVQTSPYWTLTPHSALSSILLNQGLLGLVLVFTWAVKGFLVYLRELKHGEDLAVISGQTAVLFLGLHSLVDADLNFGALGILFWLLAGLYSTRTPSLRNAYHK